MSESVHSKKRSKFLPKNLKVIKDQIMQIFMQQHVIVVFYDNLDLIEKRCEDN